MNGHSNYSFKYSYFQERDEEANCSFNVNLVKEFDSIDPIEKNNNTMLDPNLNFSQLKKKTVLEDISSSIEHTFSENSHMEEEIRFHPNDNGMEIDNEDRTQWMNSQDIYFFDQGPNDSFLHENTYLINNLGNETDSYEKVNNTVVLNELKIDSAQENAEFEQIKRNFTNIKLSKTMTNNLRANKSSLNIQKPLFAITNISASTANDTLNTSVKLNLNISKITKPKRGRIQFLLKGIKIEVIDRAYIREFRKFLKFQGESIKTIIEDDKSFWEEFFQNNNPPFYFTQLHGEREEYKSFSKQYLKTIFSRPSAIQLYTLFIKEKGKELLNCIIGKKIKRVDSKALFFYDYYGRNLHKFYSDEYDVNSFTYEDIESNCVD